MDFASHLPSQALSINWRGYPRGRRSAKRRRHSDITHTSGAQKNSVYDGYAAPVDLDGRESGRCRDAWAN